MTGHLPLCLLDETCYLERKGNSDIVDMNLYTLQLKVNTPRCNYKRVARLLSEHMQGGGGQQEGKEMWKVSEFKQRK